MSYASKNSGRHQNCPASEPSDKERNEGTIHEINGAAEASNPCCGTTVLLELSQVDDIEHARGVKSAREQAEGEPARK